MELLLIKNGTTTVNKKFNTQKISPNTSNSIYSDDATTTKP